MNQETDPSPGASASPDATSEQSGGAIGPGWSTAKRRAGLLPESQRSRFLGYVRDDGRVGTRNYIGIFIAGNCAATAARMIAEKFTENRLREHANVDGVLPFIHEIGCGMEMTGEPMNLLRRTIAGTLRNPNIFGAVVLALGCERNNIRGFFAQEGLVVGPRLHMIVLQEVGGTAKAIAAGIEAVEAMLPAASACERESVSAEHLVVGLQSASTDGFMAISADPSLGAAVDLLVANGGTAILSDTPGLVTARAELTARAATPEIGHDLSRRIEWWHGYQQGRDTQLNRPVDADQQTLAANRVLRAGIAPVQAAYEYGEQVSSRGLAFMDSPSYTAVSATGQIAGGANMLCLTTGTGSTFDAGVVPTLKLASNSATFDRLQDDLDIDCGPVADGLVDAHDMGTKIFSRLLAHASGEPTKGEQLDLGENSFVPWSIGVMA
jgi:altronate hydrolase